MTGKELQDYVKTAIGLETDIATQERIVTLYKQNSQSRKPTLSLLNEPTAPDGNGEVYREPFFSNTNIAAMSLVLGIVAFFVGFCFYGGNLVDEARKVGHITQIVGVLLMIPFVIKKVLEKNQQKKMDDEYQRRYDTYRENLAKIKEGNKKRTDQYNRNLGVWSQGDSKNTQLLIRHIDDTRKILNKLYEKDVIYEKYRNLPALTSIYEYLVTERCDELKGPHGAYNIYEDEIRKDKVISQLNTVIENLEQIRLSQFMLYQQVRAIQDQTANIESEMHRISGYAYNIAELTALNTYYNALTSRCAEINTIYHLLP